MKIHTKKSSKSPEAHGFLFQLNLLLLFSLSLAPLSLWHCPIFPLSVCLSVCLCLSLTLPVSWLLAPSFWTMTLRDSCNVRRLAILAGAFESRGSREGEGLYLRLGALTSLITLFFFLLLFYSFFMSATITHLLPFFHEWKKCVILFKIN